MIGHKMLWDAQWKQSIDEKQGGLPAKSHKTVRFQPIEHGERVAKLGAEPEVQPSRLKGNL